MTMNTMIGIDLAKRVFQFHVATMTGEVLLRRKLPRDKVHEFMAAQEPAVVVMEACGSAHYWAREFRHMGHVVRLIAPQYVRPFVKRQKNDAADAEAIVVAAQRPEMRFIEPKTAEQQAKAVLFRSRGRLVNQRTEVINGLRSVLYEYGYVVPQRTVHLPLIREIVEDPSCDLPELARDECRDMLDQIDKLNERIDAKTVKIRSEALKTPVARRLETMPGVGPITALAIEAYAPPMEVFDNANLIYRPSRRLPIVAVSTDEWGGAQLNLEALGRRLSGAAHLYSLHPETSWELTRLVDKRMSTFNGGVRIYMPGIVEDDEDP